MCWSKILHAKVQCEHPELLVAPACRKQQLYLTPAPPKKTQKTRDLLDLLVVGVNDALRLVDWLTAGGGGGIVGGADWVFTSAGESGIVPTFCTLLPAMEREKGREVRRQAGHWDAALG